MSLKPAGPLDTYNSLTDEYLVDYFNNKRIRRHLRQMGLITRQGEVVDEPTFRYNIARKEHKTHVKELMSQAVINKTLELERNRRAFIRDKLIEIRKIETVNKVKRERDMFAAPSTAERGSSRPKSMPQLPEHDAECVAGVTIPPGSVVKWVPLIVPPYGSTPYLAPVVPGLKTLPPRPKSEMVRRKTNTNQIKPRPKSATLPAQNQLLEQKQSFFLRRQVHSMSKITLRYLGRSLDLSSGMFGDAADVMIMQQHCGGNTVCVFQGLVSPNETFTFTSRRHRDAPFGITIYIGNMMDTRLSTCCEYRHKAGHILGGKSGHFSLVGVEGCMPCYKCFAHISEFKREESAAHQKFREEVKKPREDVKSRGESKREKQTAKPTSQASKKKKIHKKKKEKSEHLLSDSEDEARPVSRNGQVTAPKTVESKKVAQVTEDGVTEKEEGAHELRDPGMEEVQLFKRLVVNSPHPDDEEDELVLQASDSDGETQLIPAKIPAKEEELKLESEESSEDEREETTVVQPVPEPVKEAAVSGEVPQEVDGGYEEEKFDSDDDNKSEASVTSSIKSEASHKSESSLSSIKSASSVKSESSVKSGSSIKSDASVKSNASIKSDSTIKSDATAESNGSVKSDKSSSSTSTVKSDSSRGSAKSSSSRGSDRTASSLLNTEKMETRAPSPGSYNAEKKDSLLPDPRAPSPEVSSGTPEPRAASPEVEVKESTENGGSVSPEAVDKEEEKGACVDESRALSPPSVARSPSPTAAPHLQGPSELEAEEYKRSPSPRPLSPPEEASAAVSGVEEQDDTVSNLSTIPPVGTATPDVNDDRISMLSGMTESTIPDSEFSQDSSKEPGLGKRTLDIENNDKVDQVDEEQLSPRHESDNESEHSSHSNHDDDKSETTTSSYVSDAEPTSTPNERVFSPTQSILSTDSSKSKDPTRRIRFSETVTQRVASDDEELYEEEDDEVEVAQDTQTTYLTRQNL